MWDLIQLASEHRWLVDKLFDFADTTAANFVFPLLFELVREKRKTTAKRGRGSKKKQMKK
ncbi:hypothetical protein [Paenibacillus terreus]|uniref:hypothetical protein n=1 Tax=Paenibacillus terreus TaxID=1387834 RepID=UPI0035CCDB6D